jgi:hypothetical protein
VVAKLCLVRLLEPPEDLNTYDLLFLRHRIRHPAASCPACGTPADVAAPRIGLFALACLHIARVAALVNVLAVLAAGGVLAWNAHYFLAAFLVLLGVPVSIGHFVAFGLLIDYAQTE